MSRHLKLLQRSFAGGEMAPDMYSRVDDASVQAGCALMKNAISQPQGSFMRRPGTRLVREVKDSALDKRVELVPFTFATGDTFTLEFGRAEVNTIEVGYIRFHTDGGTLLYEKPRDYVAPVNLNVFAVGNPVTSGVAHLLTTGDPIVFCATPATAVTIQTVSPFECVLATASTLMDVGAQVVFNAVALPTIVGSTPLEAYRIYYVVETSATGFRVSTEPNGAAITFSSAGTTVVATVTPSVSVGTFKLNTVYYARNTGGSTITVHNSELEATTNYGAKSFTKIGTGAGASFKMQFAYESGDTVYVAGTGPHVCRKRTWVTKGREGYCYSDDYQGHSPPAFLNYWTQISGSYSAVTADSGTNLVTWAAHGLASGDPIIFTSGTAANPLVDGTVYYVIKADANTFYVSAAPFGALIDLTSNGVAVTAFANSFYEVPHDYSETEIAAFGVAQSNDVMSLASQHKPFAELRRLSNTNWRLEQASFRSNVDPPQGLACTPFRGEAYTLAIDAAGVTTVLNGHPFSGGETVYVFDVPGLPSAYSQTHWRVGQDTTPGDTSAAIITLDSLDTGARSSPGAGVVRAGYMQPSLSVVDLTNYYVVTSIDDDGVESGASNQITVTNNLYVQGAHNPLTWTAARGANRYRVYKKSIGVFGLIGETTTASFTDDNITPDLSIAPPIVGTELLKEGVVVLTAATGLCTAAGHGLENGMPIIFGTNCGSTYGLGLPTQIVEGTTYYVIGAGTDTFQVSPTPFGTPYTSFSLTPAGITTYRSGFFPGAVAYFEQRRCLAGSLSRPQDVWMTASGTESDLSYSIPTVDSDRILFRVATRDAAVVRHMVPLSHLMLLTSSSELRVTPVNDDALTPSSVSVRPQSYVGSSDVQPAIVNSTVVFAADRGGHIRELGYSQDISGYLAGDLSLRARHLFDGLSVSRIAYQKAPVPVLWFPSSNGKLLGLTYVPEERVGAWHQHITDGTFESVCSVPEDTEDRIYVAVKRGTKRYIERLAVQAEQAIADCFYVDCGVTYSGAATTSLQAPHLAGETVSFLADGIVGSATVSGAGVLTIPTAATKVHYGLPFVTEVQTMPMAMQVDAFGSGKTKNINSIWLRILASGAFQAGPTSTNFVTAPRPPAGQLLTSLVEVMLPAAWSDEGQIYIRQSNPLPLTVAGLTIEVATGG